MAKSLSYVFIIIVLIFSTIMFSKIFNFKNTPDKESIEKIVDDKNEKNKDVDINNEVYNDNIINEKPKEKVEYDTLEEAIKNSRKINVLVLGVEEDPRTDTIILASFDTEYKDLDLISIPRDTYYKVKGYDSGDHRKINAAYARTREKGAKEAVEDILNIPIDYYVSVKYEGVVKIVDALGGVEIYVPIEMYGIPEGTQVLNGEDALVFLRFRKGYSSGDIGRVEAQQEFIKAAMKKALSYKLPLIIKHVYNAVKTDMSFTDALYYVYKAMDIDTEDIIFYILPGKSSYEYIGGKNWFYYRYNKEETKEMIYEIYNVKNVTE